MSVISQERNEKRLYNVARHFRGRDFFGVLSRWPHSHTAVAALRAFARRRKPDRHGGALKRKALDAARSYRFLGADRARVDAHPGDLGREAAVFDFWAAVHHHL